MKQRYAGESTLMSGNVPYTFVSESFNDKTAVREEFLHPKLPIPLPINTTAPSFSRQDTC